MIHYISRSDIIEEACHRMLKEMYMRAQPPVDIDTYVEAYKSGKLDKEKDKCYEWHYLPAPIQNQIVEDYLEAYNANDQMREYFEWLLDLFKNGGHRTVYKDIFGTGEETRTGEETEKLPELIGEENAEKVYGLINDFLGFYRRNMDECSIRWSIMQGPTSNPKTAEEHWGIVVDDNVYKNERDEWDYAYKDYYDGKINEDSWYAADLEDSEFNNEEN